MSRLTLAQQLKQLEEDAPRTIDPESAYAALDSHERPAREGDEGREHYVDVGPSRLRAQADAEAAQTLLTEKYGGKSSSRNKIFDDDDDEEEEDEGEGAGGEFDEDEDEDEEEDDEEDEEDEEDDEDEEDEEEDDEEHDDRNDDQEAPSGRTLDPVGALRASREKDIEKGRGIKRQKDLFDQLLAVRITFQKALSAGFQIPAAEPEDPAGEVADARVATLQALGKLSDSLFSLREKITLPGTEESKKRKRSDDDEENDVTEESYWKRAAADSLALVDASHPALVPILHKWSTKIQAATAQLGSKAAGGSKFMQSARGTTGVVDAIDASLAQRRDHLKPLMESEEHSYRALLREVIESKQGSGNVDLSHLRREKKKKREAERGGSKGRKLRYTVHDKAVNFVVPIPLEQAWHEEQVDELFASLFGGAGKAGAVSDLGGHHEAFTELGGLKVF